MFNSRSKFSVPFKVRCRHSLFTYNFHLVREGSKFRPHSLGFQVSQSEERAKSLILNNVQKYFCSGAVAHCDVVKQLTKLMLTC